MSLREFLKENKWTLVEDTKSRRVSRVSLAGIMKTVGNAKTLREYLPGQTHEFNNCVLCDDSEITKSQLEYTGGRRSDLNRYYLNGRDLTQHKKHLAEIKSGYKFRDLIPQTASLESKRKFRASEQDGDWIYSKRFDDKPFVESHKKFRPNKVIEIACSLSFGAHTDAIEIDKFGAYVWALINVIESNGFTARVIVYNKTRQTWAGCDLSIIEVVVKEPGQYVSPGTLALAISGIFKRLALIPVAAIHAELSGQRVDGGFGAPIQEDTPVTFQNGRITLSGIQAAKISNELIEALRCALKGN